MDAYRGNIWSMGGSDGFDVGSEAARSSIELRTDTSAMDVLKEFFPLFVKKLQRLVFDAFDLSDAACDLSDAACDLSDPTRNKDDGTGKLPSFASNRMFGLELAA